MFRPRFPFLAAALASYAFSGTALGSGFALIEQNASGLGNAYAGQAAVAADASTIFFNPAGMTHLPGTQLVVAGNLVMPSIKFSGSFSAPVGGGQGSDAAGLAVVPNLYVTHAVTPDIYLGVGVNAPFGLKTDYASDWVGRYQAVKSEVNAPATKPFRL